MNALIAIIGAGAVSYLLRVSMLVLAARLGLPAVVESAARFAVPVAFAALATTALLPHLAIEAGTIAPAVAIGVALVAVRRTGSASAALLAGMPALWILSAVLPT